MFNVNFVLDSLWFFDVFNFILCGRWHLPPDTHTAFFLEAYTTLTLHLSLVEKHLNLAKSKRNMRITAACFPKMRLILWKKPKMTCFLFKILARKYVVIQIFFLALIIFYYLFLISFIIVGGKKHKTRKYYTHQK